MTSDKIDKMSDEEYKSEYDWDEEDEFLISTKVVPYIQKEQDSFKEDLITEAKNLKSTNTMKSYANHHKKSLDDQLNMSRSHGRQLREYETNETIKNVKASKEQAKFSELDTNSKKHIQRINYQGLCLWKNKNKYFFRKNINAPINSGTKDEAGSFFSGGVILKIVDYKSIIKKDIVTNDKVHKYILEHQIPNIESEVFNPQEDEFFELNGVMYKNSFEPTEYLKKRFKGKK